MKFIGKTKIEQKRSKPTITYPLIRLPREFAEMIGTPATIYQTRHKDSTAFFVVLGDNNSSLLLREKLDNFGTKLDNQLTEKNLKLGFQNWKQK